MEIELHFNWYLPYGINRYPQSIFHVLISHFHFLLHFIFGPACVKHGLGITSLYYHIYKVPVAFVNHSLPLPFVSLSSFHSIFVLIFFSQRYRFEVVFNESYVHNECASYIYIYMTGTCRKKKLFYKNWFLILYPSHSNEE